MTPDPIIRLKHDLAQAATTLSLDEARFLVDAYYRIQDNRKASASQVKALAASNEPHAILEWLFDQNRTLESQINRALDRWTEGIPLSVWAKSITGIGPVISAGLAAHIDISKAPTAGHIWRYAGLDPSVEWKPKTKRPWNASLKVLCWKIGESFVKVSSNENDFYGHLWAQRKDIETARNERGEFAQQAAQKLVKYSIGKTTEAYKAYSSGKLPPAHVHARAKRWVVKLFLSHYQEVGWTIATGTPPADPYAVAILGHGHRIMPPNWETTTPHESTKTDE